MKKFKDIIKGQVDPSNTKLSKEYRIFLEDPRVMELNGKINELALRLHKGQTFFTTDKVKEQHILNIEESNQIALEMTKLNNEVMKILIKDYSHLSKTRKQ